MTDTVDIIRCNTTISSSDISNNESLSILSHRPHPSFTKSPAFNNGVGSDSISPFPISLKGGSSGSPRRSGMTAVSPSHNSTPSKESRAVESLTGGGNAGVDTLKFMGESSYDCRSSDSNRKVVEVAVHCIAGPPRMWQRAVMLAAGYEEPRPNSLILKGEESKSVDSKVNCLKTSRVPPIVLFLLSDAERLLDRSSSQHSQYLSPSNGRNPVGGLGVTDELQPPVDFSSASFQSVTNDLDAHKSTAHSDVNIKDSHISNHMIDEKLHSTAFRIWRSFQSWGLNPHKKNLIPDSERSKLDNNYRATVETYDDNKDFYEINIHLLARKDPIYSMILSAIIEYQQISTRFFHHFKVLRNIYHG